MIDAYVFIMTEVGNQALVAQELAQLPGVIRAVVVTGPYDVMARVAAPDMDPLGELIINHIQAVNGVVRTVTCPIVHL